MCPTRLHVVSLASMTLALVACVGGGDGPPPVPTGSRCDWDDGACESGLCRDFVCTEACTSDADCAGNAGGLVQCGLANVCVVPLADLGETCTGDRDCRSGNCSAVAGVCRVPLETACDATNCDICLSDGSGWSYCSRDCIYDAGIECPEDRCVGYLDQNFFYCWPSCTGCRGECRTTSDGSIRYCDARLGTDWTMTSAPAAELQPCRFDSMCSEGTCLAAPSCDSRSSSCTGSRGYCSAACSSDADCGGGHCVDVPCDAGSTDPNCGPRCLPGCEVGSGFNPCSPLADATCRALRGVDGSSVGVCDPRNDDGGRCRTDDDCASGACSSAGRCTASGGAANGSSCGAPGDCASGNCQSGTCRGTSLRGDPCATSFDCSVGTCVSGICD